MKHTLSRWHPWPEKEGRRHISTLWEGHSVWKDIETHFDPGSAQEAIDIIGRERLYVFCNDPMDYKEFEWSDDLLLNDRSDVYVQKTGKVVAVRVQSGRYSGFFIPARTWGFAQPSFEMIEVIDSIYELFGFEAITPASLGEKIVRSTLEEKIKIFRPASHLRQVLLLSGGGRIDCPDEAKFYKQIWKYDRRKAYLSYAKSVPDIFFPPKYHIQPRESWLYDYATPGYWEVTMVSHGEGLHPIFLQEGERKRFPKEGEQFKKWLWRDEILACEQKGYTLLFIHQGYRWPRTTDFLTRWADLMWEKFQMAESEEQERIIKGMIVGFFGRCLAEPINHFLVPLGEQKKGDIAIPHNWLHHLDNWQDGIEGKKFFTNWYLRAEYNEESTALTPIGAWVIKECRMEMYRLACVEEQRGNKLINIYIDSATFEQKASALSLGPLPGQYREEEMNNVWAVRNALISDDEKQMRAPGYKKESEERTRFWKKYNTSHNPPPNP